MNFRWYFFGPLWDVFFVLFWFCPFDWIELLLPSNSPVCWVTGFLLLCPWFVCLVFRKENCSYSALVASLIALCYQLVSCFPLVTCVHLSLTHGRRSKWPSAKCWGKGFDDVSGGGKWKWQGVFWMILSDVSTEFMFLIFSSCADSWCVKREKTETA